MEDRHRCDDCGETFSEEELEKAKCLGLHTIAKLTERIDPGCLVPSGECPDCRALVYPEKPRFVTREMEDKLRELVDTAEEMEEPAPHDYVADLVARLRRQFREARELLNRLYP